MVFLIWTKKVLTRWSLKPLTADMNALKRYLRYRQLGAVHLTIISGQFSLTRQKNPQMSLKKAEVENLNSHGFISNGLEYVLLFFLAHTM
jgi:hypothetical protein